MKVPALLWMLSIFDALITYYHTPDLKYEGNILVTEFSFGWGKLLIIVFFINLFMHLWYWISTTKIVLVHKSYKKVNIKNFFKSYFLEDYTLEKRNIGYFFRFNTKFNKSLIYVFGKIFMFSFIFQKLFTVIQNVFYASYKFNFLETYGESIKEKLLEWQSINFDLFKFLSDYNLTTKFWHPDTIILDIFVLISFVITCFYFFYVEYLNWKVSMSELCK